MRQRLFLQFLSLSILPVVLVTLIAATVTANGLVQTADSHNAALALSVRDQLASRLSARQKSVETLASLVSQPGFKPEQVQAMMQEMVARDPYLEGLYITNEAGTVDLLALTPKATLRAVDLRGLDLSSRPFFSSARHKSQVAWSDTFLSSLSGRVAVAMAVPAGERTVVAELSLQTLSESVRDLRHTQRSLIIVTDHRGRVIIHPDHTLAAKQENLGHEVLIQAGMSGKQANGEFLLADSRYQASVAPIEPANWSVLVGQPRDIVYGPVFRLGWAVLGGMMLALAASLTASLLLARRTAQRYQSLLTAAESLVNGVETVPLDLEYRESELLWERLKFLFNQVTQKASDSQEARAQLQAVLDGATEVAIIAADVSGHITVFNKGAEKMLGYTAQQCLGRTPEMFHVAQEVQDRALALSIELGKPVSGFETFVAIAKTTGYEVRDWTYIRQDGSRLIASLAVTALHDVSGQLTGFLGVASDQTNRLHAAEMDIARQAAEAANQAKTEFLSRVSHELRTPLNAMLGYTQLIEMDVQHPLQKAQREQLAMVRQAGWHLVQLIEDILDLSRIETGQMRVELAPVQVNAVIRDALQLAQPLLTSSELGLDIALQLDESGTEPVHVLSDRTRLTQVLVNLLTNAIKYNRPGGRVTVSVAHGSGQEVIVRVADTGRGMSEAQLARIFEPFNRLGLEHSHIPGTGIGLVIIKRLIELMNGRLDVSSQLNQGSCFTVVLPEASSSLISQPGVTGNKSPVDSQARPTTASDSMRPRSALYIEDNPINTMLMEAIFTQRPAWRMHTATSASEGASLASRIRPDLILLDLHLPDGSGVALLHRLRAVHGLSHTRIVAVSADATQTQIESVLAAGACAYLTKPLDVSDVLDVLDEPMHATH